jgi:archaellum component FlaC
LQFKVKICYIIRFFIIFRRLNEWNEYQKKLENQNTEYQKALCRKEQFIKHLEFNIDSLTQDLENNKIHVKCTKSNLHESNELEACKNKLETLANIVANMTCKFATAESSYQHEITEMR